MIGFLLRRLAWFALTLWSVVTVAFFLMRAAPGGPFSVERSLAPSIEAALRSRYHLDWPMWKQYLAYIGPFDLGPSGWIHGDGSHPFAGVLSGDFGPSFKYRDFSVNDVLAQSLPVSLELGLAALCFAVVIGVSAGLLCALFPRGKLDLSLRMAATAGIAIPNFVLASLLILLFVFLIPIFPVAGWGGPSHLILPAVALGTPVAAYIARLVRAGLFDALSQDFVRTAVAKGMPTRVIVLRHALRQGLLPVVSYLGPAAAGILTGSLVIEKIFFIPGTGQHFVNSALNRDYTLAMGVTILYTALVFGLNTLVDVIYTLLDPRIPLEEA
ncbi:MAG TPA: ABC transporter permease subunit [Planctomycetota bacterium]|nr:ABC transporter permease subunit [Planctomycetota bacterium]